MIILEVTDFNQGKRLVEVKDMELREAELQLRQHPVVAKVDARPVFSMKETMEQLENVILK